MEEEDDDWPTHEVARSLSQGHTACEPAHGQGISAISRCQNPMMMTHPLTLEAPEATDWLTTTRHSSFSISSPRISMDSLRQVPECVPWPLLSLTLAVSFDLSTTQCTSTLVLQAALAPGCYRAMPKAEDAHTQTPRISLDVPHTQ